VEHGGQVVGQTEVGEAPRVWHPVEIALSDRVEIDEARQRTDAHQGISDRQGGQ